MRAAKAEGLTRFTCRETTDLSVCRSEHYRKGVTFSVSIPFQAARLLTGG